MDKDDRFIRLREKAQTLLSDTANEELRRQFQDIEALLEELNIHQIELEMQQEELQQANERIEAERAKYRELYEEAPVAYFTLNETGNILQLNQAAADLLETPIHTFKYTSIFPYLEKDSRIAFSRFFKSLFSLEERIDTDLTFISSTGQTVYTRAQAVTYTDPEERKRLVRCAVVDVTPRKKFEEELDAQKSFNETISRYRTFFSVTGAAFGVTDAHGLIIDCNDSLLDLLGYTREEVLGKNVAEFNHPDDAERDRETVYGLTPEAPQARVEKRFIARGDRVVWVDYTVSAVFENQEPRYYVGIIFDVTDRITAQQTIRRLNNRLEASMSAGKMAWWELDLPSGAIRANDQKATMLGYDPGNFHHYNDFMELVHPDDYEPTMEAFRRHLYGDADRYEAYYRIRHADGDYLWFHDIGRVLNREGENVTLTGIVSEITELQRTRDALEAANTQFLTILENLQVGVLVISTSDRTILYANDHIQESYDRPLLGMNCHDVFASDTEMCRMCIVNTDVDDTVPLENTESPADEYYIAALDRWFLRQDRLVHWVNGEDAALLILTDITPLKEVAALKEDIDRITQHDLKNPLNGILGGTQLMLSGGTGTLTKDQEEIVTLISESATRISTMIDQSLGLYQMEKGTYQIREESIDLPELITKILEELRPAIKGNALTVELPPDFTDPTTPLQAQGEQILCYSIFSNILKNAIEASPSGDRIRVASSRPTTDTVRIAIWNNQEIPSEIRTSFGNKYSTWGKNRGTGLGVYSARLMATTMKGSLEWETSTTKGTTIYITLPSANR